MQPVSLKEAQDAALFSANSLNSRIKQFGLTIKKIDQQVKAQSDLVLKQKQITEWLMHGIVHYVCIELSIDNDFTITILQFFL